MLASKLEGQARMQLLLGDGVREIYYTSMSTEDKKRIEVLIPNNISRLERDKFVYGVLRPIKVLHERVVGLDELPNESLKFESQMDVLDQ